MTTPVVVLPAAPPRRGFGVTSLVLGILLVLGVALWLFLGAVFFAALVWVLPIVVVGAFVIGAVHLVVAAIATATGIVALVRNSGRVPGAIGLVLTVIATAAAVFVGIFLAQVLGVFYAGAPTPA